MPGMHLSLYVCLLLSLLPRYLGSRITTLPEFMGKRFGQSTRNILAWYTIITILISWLALTLFAGGVLIRQVFDIPMWQSALLLLVISAFFTMLGGLKGEVLHECISNDTVDCSISHTGYHGNL